MRSEAAAGFLRPDRLAMRIAALFCGLVAGAGFVPSMVLPFVSLFAFDAPGSGSTPWPYLMVALLWSIPAALAGSAGCAVICLIRPVWRWLAGAVVLLAIPAAIAAVIFDPFHWRRYPPAQQCDRIENGTPRGKWVCRPLSPAAAR